MLQKQKIGDDDAENKDKSKIGDDEQAKGAAHKAKEVLDKIAKQEAERPARKGHYENCCGLRIWVPD